MIALGTRSVLEFKRNRVYRLPLLLRNEMNISLRSSPVQVPSESFFKSRKRFQNSIRWFLRVTLLEPSQHDLPALADTPAGHCPRT